MRYYKLLTYTLLFVICASCTESNKTANIIRLASNDNYAFDICIDTLNMIELETDSASILSSIGNVEKLNHNYCVQSSDIYLKVFDANGKYQFSISKIGRGANELSKISNFFINEGEICVWDNVNGLFHYNSNGEFLRKEKIEDGALQKCLTSPSKLYPFQDGYISVNSNLGGSDLKAPALSKWNKSLSKVSTIPNVTRNSGLFTYDGFQSIKDSILYWEPYSDTIYTVVNGVATIEYILDMGEYTLPSELVNAVEKIQYINDTYKGKSFIGLPQFFQKYNNRLYFTCVYPVNEKENEYCLCEYDSNSNKTRIARFYSRKKKAIQAFCKIINDNIILEVRDTEHISKNPILLDEKISNIFKL